MTFSDGRAYAHEPQIQENKAYEERLRRKLVEAGVDVVTGELVWSNETAVAEARKLQVAGVEATIFNYAVWAFPQFSVVASRFAPGPYLLFGQVNPAKPGMVAVLAAAGALDQMGVRYRRVFGEIEEAPVFQQVLSFVRGAHAVASLRGETYGLFGGRAIGINTAVAPTDLWAEQFGIDVEHVDQWEIVRRATELAGNARVERAQRWLEGHVKQVHYDGQQLTPEKLRLQIASYDVLREIIAEKSFHFVGIKSQPELTEHFVTMDVAEAFLNDPYDWDGPHDPIVCATEADMDAALTMEVFKHATGSPVLFADVRHYFKEHGLFDLVNSGAHATYFAGRSLDPETNLRNVELKPQDFFFPAGGASVFHVAQPGPVTLARLTRERRQYRMHVVRGEFVRLDPDVEARLITQVQDNWPHAFVRLACSADTFLQSFPANHIHGVYGDWVPELLTFCWHLGIEPVVVA
ncbi:fucose isomerase [Limnochorda pilosa]|uniref:FucIase n=1 Tax=Limnochorda pilosa TaxID=1555112 RepID=A0A0K2SLA1_LIMPI|nr:fucose isomerase [Limnochorda pilosa]